LSRGEAICKGALWAISLYKYLSEEAGIIKKRDMKTKFITITLIMIFINGCVLFKPDENSLIPDGTPGSFSLYTNDEKHEAVFWWKDFENPELDRLIETALGANFDLRGAYARLKQAQAFSKISASEMLPQVSASAGYDHKKTDSSASTGGSTSNTFSLGLAASYELDLWGKVRSQKEADRLYMNESRELYKSAAMTVAAEIAESWIDIIATRKEIAFVNETIKANESLLGAMQLRFEKSHATALDVLQQKQALASARSSLPLLEAKERILMNNMILLTGKTGVSNNQVKSGKLPELPPVPAPGLPAELISMRPDIRAAGLHLKAADWEVSAAKAARLPSLSLTASGTYSAADVDDIFRNWIANLAASLTGPVFDAGRRKSVVKRARAVAEERIATYEKTVFSAIRDVENALVNEDKQSAYLNAIANERKAAELSLKESTRRYLAGQVSFLTMQERFLRVQALNGQQIRQKAAVLKYRIALYRALGGNWKWEKQKKKKEKRLPIPVLGSTTDKRS